MDKLNFKSFILESVPKIMSLSQAREELVLKKDELTRISGPIFQRVDCAYRRLEEVHGRQGGVFAWVQ